MKGQYEITVRNRRIQYKFTINRNITILKGDSATGKTTLIDMISEYQDRGADSGITVICDKPCVVIGGQNWKLLLANTHDSIIFIDEGDKFVSSKEFAEYAQNTNNYYVIATRNPLAVLPYSIKEIYGIKNKSGNRYQGTKRLYSEFYPIFSDNIANFRAIPDCVIVEDSNSGFEFYKSVCDDYRIECISACGNSNIELTVSQSKYSTLCVIADGAAFGPYVEKLVDMTRVKNIILFLPESFEWLILKSVLSDDSEVRKIIQSPSEYIESREYFSWEKFFTQFLTVKTQGTYLEYRKSKLNPVYIHPSEKDKILDNVLVNFGDAK